MANLALAGGGAGPGGNIVYDPINHVQAAISASNAVLQTAQQVQAYALQVQQYLNQLENLKRLPQEALDEVLQPYTDQIAAATSLAQTLGDTLTQIQQLHSQFNDRFRQMALQDLAPDQYLARETALAQYRGQSVDQVFQNEVGTLQAVNDNFARIRKLQQQIPASSGLQQSFQTVNQHLNLLAGQNAQLMQLIASHQANQSARQQDEEQANLLAGQIIGQRRAATAAQVSRLRQRLREEEATQGWGILSTGP